MTVRVHGGIITDQMLVGKLTYYEMSGTFINTISDGSIIIPGQEVVGDDAGAVTYDYYVGDGQPVPESAADRAFRVIIEKCTVVQIRIIDDSTIQFAVENTDNGWNTTSEGPFNATTGLDDDSDAATNMTAAIVELGTQGTVTDPADAADTPPVIPNATTGTTVVMSGVTVTEKEFILA